MAEVHARLATRTPNLLTVVAPRHPNRGPAIAEAFAARGLEVVLRSSGQAVTPETAVYLADSLGEMGLWYRLCQVVFIGGSLIPKGGQNLLEPAKLGCAIVCGPHMTNFLRVTEEMGRADALRQVANAEQLAAAVSWLLEDDPARTGMIRAAADYAGTQAGALDRIVAALRPQLDRAAGLGRSTAAGQRG